MMTRAVTIVLMAALAAALWFYHGVAVRYGLFGGRLAFALDIAASVLSAGVGVLVAAEVVAGLLIPALTTARPTGFERAGAYLLFAAAAFVLVLAHFGDDVTAVLTTSAVITAIIGLALQPTLGAFIAGFTLNADRVLKIGDAIVQNGEAHEVTAIGWRSVVCTRDDGTRTVMSNSRILDGSVDIIPSDTPARVELFLIAPLSVEPHRVGGLLTNIVAELPHVAAGRPVAVAPISFDPDKAQARYRIRYWVRPEARDASVEAVFTKIWYVFQREEIRWPVSLGFAADLDERRPSLAAPEWTARLTAALHAADACRGVGAEAAAGSGTLLLYANGERIVVPERLAGARCLVVLGDLHEDRRLFSPEGELSTTEQVTRRSELRRISARLAHVIGPYAELAVHRAAVDEPSLATIRATVALEIDDEAKRLAFLARGSPEPRAGRGIGFTFDPQRSAGGLLEPDPPLRAHGEAAIVALPADLFER